MFDRPFWHKRIQTGWKRAPIVWLTGVRRVGKTTLSKQIEGLLHLNCDLPRVRDQLRDPEFFFAQVEKPGVVLDEIHRNENPSEILKVAADEFPQLRVLATGSSTLAATSKFRDSLSGRKRIVHLPPVLASELDAFGIDLESRLLRGGLPPALLGEDIDPEFYSEWLDSFFARDVQELFNVSKRREFLDLCGLILRQSGHLAEVTSLAKHARLSRPTAMTYLEVLEVTHFLHRLTPFSGGGRREIIGQPKLYAFDTGFVCHRHGLNQIRPDDSGVLLEHMVLDEIRSRCDIQRLYYWRDKQQREIDFVLDLGGGQVAAIECKWSDPNRAQRSLDTFRRAYPNGPNLVVCGQGPNEPYRRKIGPHAARVCNIRHLGKELGMI